jgi:O-antigen/teichoic acid export membrane protein
LCCIICAGLGFAEEKNASFAIFYGLFSVIYLLRIYATVEFRLTQKFKAYFFYFCIICVGYLVGFGLYLLTNIWLLIFLTGETAALVYSFLKGNIFKKDGVTPTKKQITKVLVMVFFSIIMRDCVNQFDKIIIKQLINEAMVTQYNAISLIAKSISMLIQPINTLILTYLTVKGTELTKKQLLKFTGISLGISAAFYIACIIGTPIFVKLFYSNIYDEVFQYNLLVNLGLIVGFLSTMFMAILLSQGKTVIQLCIQSVWGIGYIVSAYCLVGKYEIWGLIYVTLIANLVKLLLAVAFVFFDKKTAQTIGTK